MKTCSTAGCEKQVVARGMCKPCWQRWRRSQPDTSNVRVCVFGRNGCKNGCTEEHYAAGFCKNCYQRHHRGVRLYGDYSKVKPYGRKWCEIPGCTSKHRANGLCSRHLAIAVRMAGLPAEPPEPRVDVAPLRPIIERHGVSALAASLGAKPSNQRDFLVWRRFLGRIVEPNGTSTISIGDADHICYAAGTHPIFLWPEEWMEGAA